MDVIDALAEWSERPGPMYRRLAGAMADAIARGDLVVGESLPAERALAASLVVARSTVVAAYDLLREQGLIESRQGSGTWIAGAARQGQANSQAPDSLRAAAYRDGGQTIDLATAALPAADAVRAALRDVAESPDDALFGSAGYHRLGLPRLREAIARQYRESGVPTTSEEILVTTGTQQAISLLAEHFLGSGDVAVVEEPTPPGALDVLRALPVTIRTAPAVAGPDGPNPVIAQVRRGSARLLYLNPTLGLTGRVLAEHDRRRLMRELAPSDIVVVGDESQRDLCFDEPPRPMVGGAASGTATFVAIGSLSKLYWGGLRIGWIRAAEPVVNRLARTKARADLGTPVISQLVAERLLEHYAETRGERIAWLEERLADALELMHEHLPEFEVTRPAGGLSLWVRMPWGLSGAFSELATRFGVSVVPGSLLSHLGGVDDRLRIVFARERAEFAEGVRRLAQAWEAFSSRADAVGRDLDGPILL
jgi:DNA-binding transcriptional MocR family regulator